ncbi:hypothetical protein OH738_20800 [Streptomyces hirsutus]|uniref:Secreted protein n=1 Tax=Streptomyces hirsutus TaxID=35620 RepID=A0ABZ1GN26_9ACTN|nr:hypothetical protein [Streptomyces hirsutus]WSD07588.1 hypothetical protein OIE73_18790 [Streptomyces hirsutus]WTD18982.1 hypothetical protein OH738_20800 [Streptomyces hirsutus]WTD76087.1 hypothetical protein OHB56_20685 [Streptomyces sp. NBC_01635]
MTHTPAAARALLASVLSVSALLTTAACSVLGNDTAGPAAPASATASSSAATPAAEQSSSATSEPGLSEEQLRAALITETDLGQPWIPTRGVAIWRDGLLKSSTKNADCRRLLDVLYTEELFGTPAGPRAVVALDDAYSGAQLRYQVAAYRPADVDRTLKWLGGLPKKCGEFTATAKKDGVQKVEVDALKLPETGDARQALRVTMTGETPDHQLTRLTLDVAVVRVGEDTITLTNGGFGDVASELVQVVVEFGVNRLTEIQKQGRVRV